MAAGETGLLYRLTAQLGLYALGTGSRVDCELQSELAGLDLLAEALRALEADAFVQTCGEERLREWERMLGIPARELSPLLIRRIEVMNRLCVQPGDFTPEGMRRCLAAAGIVGSISEDCAARRLTVTVEGGVNPAAPLSEVLENAAAFLPAHLEAVFLVNGLTWEDLEADSPTWEAFDADGGDWQDRDTRLPA